MSLKSAFSINAQSRFASAVLDGVLGHLCLAMHTFSSVVLEAMHEVSGGTLKGAMSVQNALQGSERETRELQRGTEETCISPTLICSPGKSMIFHNKGNRKK